MGTNYKHMSMEERTMIQMGLEQGCTLRVADFLEQVLGEEEAAKTAKNISARTALARFPFVKPLETFDFSYQPSIDKRQVLTLASCHYIEHGDNVIVLGLPSGRRPTNPRRSTGARRWTPSISPTST